MVHAATDVDLRAGLFGGLRENAAERSQASLNVAVRRLFACCFLGLVGGRVSQVEAERISTDRAPLAGVPIAKGLGRQE